MNLQIEKFDLISTDRHPMYMVKSIWIGAGTIGKHVKLVDITRNGSSINVKYKEFERHLINFNYKKLIIDDLNHINLYHIKNNLSKSEFVGFQLYHLIK